MTPKKKSKKVVSNPARGFATTSIASKASTAPEQLNEEPETVTNLDERDTVTISHNDHESKATSQDKALHELTPEELEKQLEESELDLLLEAHGDKIKRDVSRQTNKLQSEKRLLRAQAEPLQTLTWLSADIMDVILKTFADEQASDKKSRTPMNGRNTTGSSEDDLGIKVWTLKRVLILLGFSEVNTEEALQNVLNSMQDDDHRDSLSGKENVWGLDECFEWLSLNIQPHELPSYTVRQAQTTPVPASEPGKWDVESFNTLHIEPTGVDTSRSGLLASTSMIDTNGLDAPRSGLLASTSSINTNGHESIPSSEVLAYQSDSDEGSEVDPDTLTQRYLTLRTQLYELVPDLSEIEFEGLTKSKKSLRVPSSTRFAPSAMKILQKLRRLISDILFDRNEAAQKWAEERIHLLKADAQRRRLQVDDRVESGKGATPTREDNIPSTDVIEANEDAGDDMAVQALGDFFSGLPDDLMKTGGTSPQLDDPSTSSRSTTIRDFGKWNGVSPRRIFEDACKARDSTARITYRLFDRSPFSKQHAVAVHWSRNQPQPLATLNDAIACVSDSRHVHVEMLTEATPDSAQSEAYVSTVALFLVFSSIPKEEKASLRLPSVWKDVWQELSILKRSRDLEADRNDFRGIRKLVSDSGIEDCKIQHAPDTPVVSGLPKAKGHSQVRSSGQDVGLTISEQLKAVWSSKSTTPSFDRMLQYRNTLPIWSFKGDILRTIDTNQIVIVCGDTGCGKSTQVPSFILEHQLSLGRVCKVYCTEPRRISAISLARRVCEELGEHRNDLGTLRSLVGYAIRLESRLTSETKLVYATTGIVMRMLEASDDLREITHLILDEVHERSIESDFLLMVLRKLLPRRPTLKVVLMSATVDAAKFSRYLGGAPVFDVPGRTYPVETKYLEDAIQETNFTNHDVPAGVASIDVPDENEDSSPEPSEKGDYTGLESYTPRTRNILLKFNEYRVNYDLILSLLELVARNPQYAPFSKAILVFLPGLAEIRRVHDMLVGHITFRKGWYIHALHSTIAMDEQERAFALPPPGHRKIVLATNIAETGVTIPDVTCVVDTGKHKEMRFDERRQLSRLIEVFASRANAKQRRGRAGRVQNGLCFHLFTKHRHDHIMAPQQTPEMLRLSLQDLVLRVKICKMGSIEDTLSEALDPPSAKNIRRAIDALVDVKALTVSEELTPLGRQLAKLPLDVFLGKLILLGCIFSCLDATVTIAAIISSKSPFAAPMGSRSQADQARLAFKTGQSLLPDELPFQLTMGWSGDSDLLTVYNAYAGWRRVCNSNGSSEQQYCRKHFLLPQNLVNIEELKSQLLTCLVDAGFVELEQSERASVNKIRSWSSKRSFVEIPSRYDAYATDLIVNSIIAWSFYPKILKRDGKGWRNISNNQSVSLHPTSVNKAIDQPPKWLSFYHIMQSSNKYGFYDNGFYNAHETSAADPFALIMACGEADIKV
ncbi:MAG: hypothetical protein Q9220_006684 [cf. Caloplaca sp. 1 TL-2023]